MSARQCHSAATPAATAKRERIQANTAPTTPGAAGGGPEGRSGGSASSGGGASSRAGSGTQLCAQRTQRTARPGASSASGTS